MMHHDPIGGWWPGWLLSACSECGHKTCGSDLWSEGECGAGVPGAGPGGRRSAVVAGAGRSAVCRFPVSSPHPPHWRRPPPPTGDMKVTILTSPRFTSFIRYY